MYYCRRRLVNSKHAFTCKNSHNHAILGHVHVLRGSAKLLRKLATPTLALQVLCTKRITFQSIKVYASQTHSSFTKYNVHVQEYEILWEASAVRPPVDLESVTV